MKVIKAARLPSGLAPIYMRFAILSPDGKRSDRILSADNGQFLISDIRLGSRSDSYYEYLL
jgi:hypothetical protein